MRGPLVLSASRLVVVANGTQRFDRVIISDYHTRRGNAVQCTRDPRELRVISTKKPITERVQSPQGVLRRLVQLLRERGLSVGSKLPPIRELATELGTRPTAVRDALLQAQTMGLVEIVPRSGAFLRTVSYAPLVEALSSTLAPALVREDHNLFELLDARRLLEIELCARAAENRRLERLLPARAALEAMLGVTHAAREEYVAADVRFHAVLAELSGNAVLCTLQQALLDLLRPHLITLPWTPERRAMTDASHRQIYTAVAAGDPAAARTAMQDHLSLAYDSLLEEVRCPPDSPATRAEDSR